LLIGKISSSYVIGAYPNHQWDVGGPGEMDISLTTVQLFGTWLAGGGWVLGSAPILSFNHESDEWSIPLNIFANRTVIIGKTPWRIGLQVNYYVAQPDDFGPEWMIGFNVAPVVKNIMANWFK
jgi:hypothetical protein